MATTRRKAASRSNKSSMPRTVFAFPKERKEPLNDARHVRNAVARFDQVQGVTDKERDAAWRRIRAAARRFGVHINAVGWRSLMSGGKSGRSRSTSRSR